MENTKKINFDKICRTCLLESPVLVSLKTKMENSNRTLYDVLLYVLNNNISADPSLPKQICNECEVLLCKVEEFKTRCHDSEKVIKEMIESQSRPSVKLESSSKLDEKSSVERYFELNPVNIIETVNEDAKIEKFETEDKDSKVEVNEVIKEELSDDFSDGFDDLFEEHEQNIPQNNDSHTCLCGKVFSDSNQYQIHLDSKNCLKTSKNELLSIPAKCEECNVVFKNTKAFKIHVKVHNTDKPYQCKLCTKKFKNNSSFLTHIQRKICKPGKRKIKKKNTHQTWILPTKCEECGTVFESMKLFKEHACIHLCNNKTQEYFQCSLCMRKFKKKSSLVTHLKNHEEKDNLKYTCDICKREFKYQAHLDNHNNLEHNTKKNIIPLVLPVEDTNSSDKKHRCKICSKAFTMLSTLTDHMRTHTGERPFLCSVCGRGFTQKTNLAQHMRRHLGLKPFKCNECETRFVSKGELDAHTRKHSGAHPFVCDECGNGFTTSSSLRKHKRVHTGERPYACDLCPMKFAVSGTLKSHRRTHTGEKPYHCSHCEKAFVQRQDLVSHIRCHTGERPYVCVHCGQAFRKASALKAHFKAHRPGAMGLPTLQGMQNS